MNKMRYAAVKTLGNDEHILKWFESKDEAIIFGRDYFNGMQPGDGVITIEGIRDGDPQHRIVSGWHF